MGNPYYTNPELASLKEELETVIDEKGLGTLLDAIAEICREKAEFVLTNWQDKSLAKEWERSASKVQTASDQSLF